MSNDFFDNHPMLGSIFDFNRDGSLNLGEAGTMGAFAAMYASEALRASEEAERDLDRSPWEDEDDSDELPWEDEDEDRSPWEDDDDLYESLWRDKGNHHGNKLRSSSFRSSGGSIGGSKGAKRARRKSGYAYEDVDASSRESVMTAIHDYDDADDIELLVEEALDNGVRFVPRDIIRLSNLIWDQELLVRLISSSKPRFLQQHANELAPRWGVVELNYHKEAFDEERREGDTYYVNTPEEDW